MKKKRSLQTNIFLYLSIFAIAILGGLWLFDIVFLDSYYQYFKNSEIKKIGNKVATSYKSKDYEEILDILAFEEDICIEITNSESVKYSTNNMNNGCIINSEALDKKKLEFMSSSANQVTYKLINPKYQNKILIYGIKLDNNAYAFISTSLEPIGNTVQVLQKLMIYVSIIVLLIASIIAYTISKRIANPIVKITDITKTMNDNNYKVDFKTDSDIEEIYELETTLNKVTDELSKTDELRRELLANVSHDLKTPLTLIKANSEMVRDLTYNNKEKRDKNLNTITSEVERLNLLVEDVLDLSKMQSKSVPLKLEVFDLDEMIKTILERFQVLCDRDGYKIEYTGFSVNIKADKKKIEQVIYNLLNNAINYTDNNLVYIKLIDNKNKVRLEITDKGKGIKESDLKYIWDKYYKVDKKYKRVTYGTGLGLSIVKNILVLHNLEYGVNTKENEGTTFYVVFDKEK